MTRKLKYWVYRLKFNFPFLNNHRPIHIDLELNRSCNLQCPFCYRQANGWRDKFPNDIMPPGDARFYLWQAYNAGIRAVKFNWRGDPSCYPELAYVCKYAHDLGYLDVMINTNLAAKSIQYVLDAEQYLTEIRVSIDTLRRGQYAEKRPPADVETTLDNLFLLSRVYDGRLIVQRRTDHECEGDQEFIRKLFLFLGRPIRVESKPVQPRTGGGVSTYASRPRRYCKQPSQRIVIGVDGKVFVCCMAYNEPWDLCLGDANKGALQSFIDSEYRDIVRRRLQKNDFMALPSCEKCTSYTAYEVKK